MKHFSDNVKIYNILGTRKIWFTISGTLMIASIAVWAVFGLRIGIDFTGGSLLHVSYPETSPTALEITNQLASLNLGEIVVQPSNDNTVILKTRFVENAERAAILTALGEGVVEESFESIGPTIGQELRDKAVQAIIFVVIVIVVYVAIAFRKVSKGPVPAWAFGVSAIIALIHDILITIGVFVVLGHYYGIEINVMFITALLTILGFSVNDTIVVFDRIREGLKRSKAKTFEAVINESINFTLMRSFNTSSTTLIVLLAMLLFGGETIRYFVLALTIGIAVGTYSSIFIASPLLLIWQKVLKR